MKKMKFQNVYAPLKHPARSMPVGAWGCATNP